MTTKDDLKRRLPGWARPWGDLAVDTSFDALDDRVPGLAAEVAFYSLLSVPPLLVTLFAFAGLVATQYLTGGATLAVLAADRTGELVGPFLDPDSTEQLTRFVNDIVSRTNPGQVASIGFLITLFTASRALRVLTVAITIAYDLEDARPTWQQFLWGMGLTVGVLVASLVLIPALLAGPGGGAFLQRSLGMPAAAADVWRVAYWPAAVVVAVLGLTVLYHVAAPWWTPWRRDLPGAVLGTAMVLAGTGGLRVYASFTFDGDSAFGPLAAPVALMLFLYVVALGVLLGAELNAEIEKRWPTAEGPLPQDPPADAPA